MFSGNIVNIDNYVKRRSRRGPVSPNVRQKKEKEAKRLLEKYYDGTISNEEYEKLHKGGVFSLL